MEVLFICRERRTNEDEPTTFHRLVECSLYRIERGHILSVHVTTESSFKIVAVRMFISQYIRYTRDDRLLLNVIKRRKSADVAFGVNVIFRTINIVKIKSNAKSYSVEKLHFVKVGTGRIKQIAEDAKKCTTIYYTGAAQSLFCL